MPRTGRPKKEIDQRQFENMCIIQCTEEEICMVLGVSDETLNKWCKKTYGMTFLEVFRQKRSGGKASLRRKQWNLADKNPSMAIWLGKVYLDQREQVSVGMQMHIEDDPITKALKESGVIGSE